MVVQTIRVPRYPPPLVAPAPADPVMPALRPVPTVAQPDAILAPAKPLGPSYGQFSKFNLEKWA